MTNSRLDDSIELKFDKECKIISSTDAEFWEKRNAAILNLISIVSNYENVPQNVIQEVFSMNIFRMLKDPLKSMISDLRSQQVRDTCLLLNKLSEVTKNHMKHLLRDIFQSVLDGIKVPNRVLSGYVDTCIIEIIKHTVFKTGLPILFNEIKESKAKFVRERCLEYINEILITWELNDKDIDIIADAIRIGLEDASVRAREIARLGYLNLYQLNPKRTEKIKSNLPTSLKTRLLKAENDHSKHIEKIISSNEYKSGVIENHVLTNTVQVITEPVVQVIDDDTNTNSNIEEKETSNTPNRILSLRIRRQSCEVDAITSIQALIRGKLSRKQSLSGPILPQDDDAEEGDDKSNFNRINNSQIDSPEQHNIESNIEYPSNNLDEIWRNSSNTLSPPTKTDSIVGQNIDISSPLSKTNLSNLLKLKISSMMDTLNQQLEIAEDLEKDENNKMNLNDIISELIVLTEQEINIALKFNKLLEKK